MIHDDIIRSLRIVQLTIVILSIVSLFHAGWLPMMIGVLVVILLQLVIIEISLAYWLKERIE